MDAPNPDATSQPLTPDEQKELEAFANEFCDSEFEPLWKLAKDNEKKFSKKDLAEEFFYQGVLAILAIQKMEDKELDEQEARRFQYE